MTDKEFKNENMYQFMMHILRTMQEKGIINAADFEEAEKMTLHYFVWVEKPSAN